MGLRFPGSWRFQPPADGQYIYSAIPPEAVLEFVDIIDRISGQGDRWEMLEHFKTHFGIDSRSSNEGWAESDLRHAMTLGSNTAPLFIERFFNACQEIQAQGLFAPDASGINVVLAKHNIGYEIRPPDLLPRDLTTIAIPVKVEAPTMAEQAKSTIEASLARSEVLLLEGRGREAVQEVVWLLETVSTALRGVETESGKIEGKYFNTIIRDLRNKRPGTTLDQILNWVTTMHGYLSSPTGGGVRHGMDLSSNVAIDPQQARLFCNLTRSYIQFFLAEHQSLLSAGVTGQR
ncbi:hypothetical protein J5226_21290 [Lysobacter sp. K5869]|uniref:hypothetical protein n=1 Tax=Lysobacter sp. K5869 TaxID=2820808 RepID=UPI001C0619E2|nr:hypothetical protein [Lysobacter sp. K5869]QWP76100.1 hypothetical protein J5226_21290 [Lysobacter sp. K5869]